MTRSVAETNQAIAYRLSNNLPRLLREFSRDFERRIWDGIVQRGYPDIRPSHSAVFANLGMGAVRVTELAERARKEIRLTGRGVALAADSLAVVDEVRAYYALKIGVEPLAVLEASLRDAVKKLQLDYLPESWVDPAQQEAETAPRNP